jgi:hypothetical protein
MIGPKNGKEGSTTIMEQYTQQLKHKDEERYLNQLIKMPGF